MKYVRGDTQTMSHILDSKFEGGLQRLHTVDKVAVDCMTF